MWPVLLVDLLDGQSDHGQDWHRFVILHSCFSLRQHFLQSAALHPLAYHRVLEMTTFIILCRGVLKDGEDEWVEYFLGH